jgi:hypothetical protein
MTRKQYEARRLARSRAALSALCQPDRYWSVSPEKLAADLKYRYRKRAAKPLVEPPRCVSTEAYLAWCKSRKHTPHPASIDPDHPIARQRLGVAHVEKTHA